MSTTIMTRSGRTESAKILLKRGAQLQAKDLKGLTALHHAARNYQVSWIQLSVVSAHPNRNNAHITVP